MTASIVVIGIGNSFRRDDGVGIAVAEEIARRCIPSVRVVTLGGDPVAVLEAWADAQLAVVVDAAAGDGAQAGRIRRCGIEQLASMGAVSSHAMALRETYELGRALQRLPDRLVVFTVDAADTGHGVGLTRTVGEAVPSVVAEVIAEASAATRDGSSPCSSGCPTTRSGPLW
ncbi:MAG TPA: hydrogenase maturation protease [Mycobacterium sp.]|nr:hydrogenase maturation protease [Mycobacterium sp.]